VTSRTRPGCATRVPWRDCLRPNARNAGRCGKRLPPCPNDPVSICSPLPKKRKLFGVPQEWLPTIPARSTSARLVTQDWSPVYQRAAVRPTEVRTAVPTIYSGHIVRRTQANPRNLLRSETPPSSAPPFGCPHRLGSLAGPHPRGGRNCGAWSRRDRRAASRFFARNSPRIPPEEKSQVLAGLLVAQIHGFPAGFLQERTYRGVAKGAAVALPGGPKMGPKRKVSGPESALKTTSRNFGAPR
jgi:hypothetical protein